MRHETLSGIIIFCFFTFTDINIILLRQLNGFAKFCIMASICLLVLCGIPGAGKSTWAKRFCSYVHERENHTSFEKQQSDGLSENGIGDKGDKEGAGEGIKKGKIQETYRVIHIAYDDLIPEELEAELIHDVQNHSKETKVVI